jgi:hypothetical protein
MKRRIVLRLMGEEVLDLTIDEDDYDDESIEPEVGALGAGVDTQPRSVGFGTPWSVEYWDDED